MRIKQNAEKIITSSNGQKEKIIKLCNLVKEIPYKRIGSFNPEDMILKGKGSCTPKHVFLASYLKRLGVPFRFLIMPFYYKKLSIAYPADRKDVVRKMPISYHVALKAVVNGVWRIIDVTWDSKLKKLGFPVNENWNGNSDMRLAVVPEGVFEKEIDPRNFEKGTMKEYTQQEQLARKEFYNLLDEILDEARYKS